MFYQMCLFIGGVQHAVTTYHREYERRILDRTALLVALVDVVDRLPNEELREQHYTLGNIIIAMTQSNAAYFTWMAFLASRSRWLLSLWTVLLLEGK